MFPKCSLGANNNKLLAKSKLPRSDGTKLWTQSAEVHYFEIKMLPEFLKKENSNSPVQKLEKIRIRHNFKHVCTERMLKYAALLTFVHFYL